MSLARSVATLSPTVIMRSGVNIVGVTSMHVRSQLNGWTADSRRPVTTINRTMLHANTTMPSAVNSLVQLGCTANAGIFELIQCRRIALEIVRHVHVENSITVSTWSTWSRFGLSSLWKFFHSGNKNTILRPLFEDNLDEPVSETIRCFNTHYQYRHCAP